MNIFDVVSVTFYREFFFFPHVNDLSMYKKTVVVGIQSKIRS